MCAPAANRLTATEHTDSRAASLQAVICDTAVNDLIKTALASANVPATLEPTSLCRDDGTRPDGLIVLPWANGRCLVWDFTCPDTLSISHLNRAVTSPGAVANDADNRKTKYSSLAAQYCFIPVAVETLGDPGDETIAFFHDLGQRTAAATADPRSFQFLMQHFCAAEQNGNAACIAYTVPSLAVDWDDLYVGHNY
jgi:hypothetical protein